MVEQGKKKLLIVDDDTGISSSYKKALSSDYEVETASTLQEADALIDGNKYDAILSDLQLTENGEEGYKVIKHARERFGKSVPIVLNSARASEEITKTALESGANFVLKKPVMLKELREKLAKK